MCGVAGTFGFGDDALIRAMTDTLIYRGPDGDGFYVRDGVCLGNRRLAILDPASGAQPMTNEDGDVIVVFNGLIYNYPELREHLLRHGHTLHTNCDTEIFAHLYEDEGIGFASKLNGIFAFALFDRRRRTLFVVRDPVGVKPIVYATSGNLVAFASEAKAVLASGIVGPELDETSLHLSMNVRYVPGTRTLFRGIRKLAPGHVLEITDDAPPREYPYTNIDWTPDHSRTRDEWMEGIRSHFGDAVERQLLSDVPLGVSLSGGIDSSSVVAMVRRAHSGPIKTFSLGFNEPWDELDDARFVAKTYETDHHELVLTEPVLPYLGEAIRHTEEPKVNSLQLYLLHRYIGDHVTVVLSGLGGDELFAGYDIYGYLQRTERMRTGWAGAGVKALGPTLDWVAGRVAALGRPQLDLATRKIEWLASAGDPTRHYLLLRNAWDFNRRLVRRVYTPEFADRLQASTRDEFDQYFDGSAPIESEVLRAEFATKMECDFLHNEDTMSMANSVESRVPFLDLDMVRFAARIPDDVRFGNGMKGLLKDAMRGVLPDRVLDKKKWGFTFDPVEQYQKDLGPMARELLTPDRLRASGVFNPKFVQAVLTARPHQRLRWHYFMLWQMIGFELWHDAFIGSATPTTAPRPWVRSTSGDGR
jgi:asparagine synthase (glutamine-hydrolysing)